MSISLSCESVLSVCPISLSWESVLSVCPIQSVPDICEPVLWSVVSVPVMSDLLEWCGRCRAPAGPPGCWWPSRGWCRSPARGTGSRSAGTYCLSGCIESPADISIMICLFIFYGQAIKRLCWGKLDCLSGLTWMFASSEVLLKVQRNLRLFPDMIRSDKFHDQD